MGKQNTDVDVYKRLGKYTWKEGNINSVYPSGVKLWANFPSLGLLVFSKIFSINMNYFCDWEKLNEYYLKNEKWTKRYCVYWVLVMCQANFLCSTSLNLHGYSLSKVGFSHFTDEAMELQLKGSACPRSHTGHTRERCEMRSFVVKLSSLPC